MNEGDSSKEPRLSGYDLEERTALLGEAVIEFAKSLKEIVKASPEHREAATPLWREANELHLIFSKIRRTTLDRP
jgi:hypothetical protein